MAGEKALEYAGSLEKEMQEVENLIPKDDSVEIAETSTRYCGALLTLICC